jgi:hypothetical protein
VGIGDEMQRYWAGTEIEISFHGNETPRVEICGVKPQL